MLTFYQNAIRYYIMLQKCKYKVILMSQTSNTTEKSRFVWKSLFSLNLCWLVLMTFLPSNSLAAGFYIIISTSILEQCQNNCPTAGSSDPGCFASNAAQHLYSSNITVTLPQRFKINICDLEITSITSCELCGTIYQSPWISNVYSY